MDDPQGNPLKRYWLGMSPDSREELAAKANTTSAYLRQVFSAGRRPGAQMALSLELATEGEISRQMLRPDLFGGLVRAA